MPKTCDNSVIDAALNFVINNAITLTVCGQQPTTYSQATTAPMGGYMLASITLSQTNINGTTTSGAFQISETIIQSVSNATATINSITGTQLLTIQSLTGTPNSTNVWTGQTSGAVFTPSSMPSSFVGPQVDPISGRNITVNAVSGIVATAGTAIYIALCSTTTLLYVDTCAPQILTAGNSLTVNGWTITIENPA